MAKGKIYGAFSDFAAGEVVRARKIGDDKNPVEVVAIVETPDGQGRRSYIREGEHGDEPLPEGSYAVVGIVESNWRGRLKRLRALALD